MCGQRNPTTVRLSFCLQMMVMTAVLYFLLAVLIVPFIDWIGF